MLEWLWQHVTDMTEDGSCQRDRLLHKEAKNLKLNTLHKSNSKNYSCLWARGLFVHLYSNWNTLNTCLDNPILLGRTQWQPLLIQLPFWKWNYHLLSPKRHLLEKHMYLSGFKCWKHIASVVFLCTPDLPGSVQPSGEVITCFLYETSICARTEHDGGMSRLAKITGTYFLLWDLLIHQPFGKKTSTTSGIPKLDICKILPLAIWKGMEAWRDVCIHTSPEAAFHRHLCVFAHTQLWVLLFLLKYTYTIASVAVPNTMYGSQVNSKWPISQNGKLSTKEVWIPKRFHRPVSELPLSLFIQQWVKQAAPEEKSAKTPRPTFSKAGCMESIRFYQLETTVKWHPICSTNVIELHGTCLGKKKPTKHKEQEYTTDINTYVKQRPLCARAFCSKSTSEKFGLFSVVFYIWMWKKKTPNLSTL